MSQTPRKTGNSVPPVLSASVLRKLRTTARVQEANEAANKAVDPVPEEDDMEVPSGSRKVIFRSEDKDADNAQEDPEEKMEESDHDSEEEDTPGKEQMVGPFYTKGPEEALRLQTTLGKIQESLLLTDTVISARVEEPSTNRFFFYYKKGYTPISQTVKEPERYRPGPMSQRKRKKPESSDDEEEADVSSSNFKEAVVFKRVTFSQSTFWESEEELVEVLSSKNKLTKFRGLSKEIQVLAAGYYAGKMTEFGRNLDKDQVDLLKAFLA